MVYGITLTQKNVFLYFKIDYCRPYDFIKDPCFLEVDGQLKKRLSLSIFYYRISSKLQKALKSMEVDWGLSSATWKYVHYGNNGCGVFKEGIQN